jgi:leucyl-tRNA synthetase
MMFCAVGSASAPKAHTSMHGASTPLSSTKSWFHVKCPCCGGPATRDPDTLDTFVDSSWYFARYLAPQCTTEIVSKEAAAKWLPVDFYVGGIEHAILHLLYARFFHKFMQREVCVQSLAFIVVP